MKKHAATYTFRYTGKAPYRARRTAKVLPVATGIAADGTETLTADSYAEMNLPYDLLAAVTSAWRTSLP